MLLYFLKAIDLILKNMQNIIYFDKEEKISIDETWNQYVVIMILTLY